MTTRTRLTRHPWECRCDPPLAWRGSDERCDRCGQTRAEGAVIWSETDARRMEFAQYMVERGRMSDEIPEHPPLIVQCGWCHDLKLGGGYIETGMSENVDDIDLGGQHYQVSHGICEPCRERLMAEMQGAGALSNKGFSGDGIPKGTIRQPRRQAKGRG